MNIQSLSIVVPTGKCINNCPYCVSKQHNEDYGNYIIKDGILPRQYTSRIEFVRDEGCNSMIITGTAEPQQNLPFIYKLLETNKILRKPFYNISLQTTGSNFHPDDIEQLAAYGVTTLALSVSYLTDDQINWNCIGTPERARTMTLKQLTNCAHENGMNVRLCVNLTNLYKDYSPESYFTIAKNIYHAEQITFRKIYMEGNGLEALWVVGHEFDETQFSEIKEYVYKNGKPIARLPYGFTQYSVNGISTVIDDNCMDIKRKDNLDDLKYAILRPNGHLYSAWNDTGSLIF